MASTERLPSKRYRGIYRDSSGRKSRVHGTFGRKSDALEAAQEKEVETRRQASTPTGALSAKTLWSEWWHIYQSERDPDSQTRVTEWNTYHRQLEPQWGNTPLNRIVHRDIQLWVDQLSRWYGASYVRRIYGTFATSINETLRRGILSASPCAGVRLPRVGKRAKPYLSLAEFAAIAEHLPQPYRDGVEMLLETGLRPGELAGLHTHRIDFDRRLLWVVDAYLEESRSIRESPKDRDVRCVPLSSRALEIIHRQLADRDLTTGCGLRHLGNKRCAHPLIFRNRRGGAMHSEVLLRRLNMATASAGVETRSPYAARRGFATRLADAGVDSFEIQRLMGHSDLTQTASYVQSSPAATARTLQALGDKTPKLHAVPTPDETAWDNVGRRGTDRGTNLRNQPLPEAPSKHHEDTR